MATTSEAPPPSIPAKMLDAVDVARILGTTPDAVRNLRRRGRLPKGRRLGKRYMWHPQALEKFLQGSEG
jgi:Helix-turn-helix domain